MFLFSPYFPFEMQMSAWKIPSNRDAPRVSPMKISSFWVLPHRAFSRFNHDTSGRFVIYFNGGKRCTDVTATASEVKPDTIRRIGMQENDWAGKRNCSGGFLLLYAHLNPCYITRPTTNTNGIDCISYFLVFGPILHSCGLDHYPCMTTV